MQPNCHLLGVPAATARFRIQCEDFVVDEVLGFEPDGEGEHCLIQVEKTDSNTAYVAQQIAGVCGVREREVSYSGLKDRHAVATQWFSVQLPGKPDPALSGLESDKLRVIRQCRHTRKLRRGTHVGNRFVITLREIEGSSTVIDERLASIAQGGFPNYFGEQRFGFDGQNIERARALFAAPAKKKSRRNDKQGLYLSAARSALFNRVLSCRIEEGTYARILPGDVMMLDGSSSVFAVEEVDATLRGRLASSDIHITGPLWGKGQSLLSAERFAWEQQCMAEDQDLCGGLEAHGLKHERRALRAMPRELSWQWLDQQTVQIAFGLGRGEFATSLLREVAVLQSSCHDTRRTIAE